MITVSPYASVYLQLYVAALASSQLEGNLRDVVANVFNRGIVVSEF